MFPDIDNGELPIKIAKNQARTLVSLSVSFIIINVTKNGCLKPLSVRGERFCNIHMQLSFFRKLLHVLGQVEL